MNYLKISNQFIVNYVHGGADTLLKHTIPMYAINEELKNKVFFILDGDKECQRENPKDYTINERNNIEFLEEKVKEIYSGNLPKVFPDMRTPPVPSGRQLPALSPPTVPSSRTVAF